MSQRKSAICLAFWHFFPAYYPYLRLEQKPLQELGQCFVFPRLVYLARLFVPVPSVLIYGGCDQDALVCAACRDNTAADKSGKAKCRTGHGGKKEKDGGKMPR